MGQPMLTNRELAALLILGGVAAFVLSRPGRAGIIESLGRLVALLCKPRLLLPLLLYVGWISLAIAFGWRLGLWNLALLKPTILWFVLSGLSLIFRLNSAIEESGYFGSAMADTLGIVAIVEFFSALESFPLWIEIPTQALAFVFAGVVVLTEKDDKSTSVRKLANGYLIILGLSALSWSIAHLVHTWASVEHGPTARELLLPIWLTPAALVFIYGFAVVAAYESSFKLMRFGRAEGSLLKQRLAMVLRANVRLGSLRHLRGFRAQRIARTDSFREAWAEIGCIRAEERQRVEEEAATLRRLVENAGLAGTDEAGRQLDQREFAETRKALRWLATCQMGHYRNRGERYRADLVPLVEPHFEQDGLPRLHGIVLYVSPDGQSWYATRQTVTGWWFAIGAAGPPPDQWLYDGGVPPQNFPSEHEWDRFGGGGCSVNWD